MQNVGGFGHLDHKGRATARQIVRRTHTGEDTVDRANLNLLRRNVAADVGEQRDKGCLAHIGAFTAHVGAGNDQHSSLR